MLNQTATCMTSALRDRLLDSMTGCIAILTASESGLFEQLLEGRVASDSLRLPRAKGAVLLHLLEQNEIVITEGDEATLTPTFAALWAAEGPALVARAGFTLMAAGDLIQGRSEYFNQPDRFFGSARTFSFFCYDRARSTGLGSLQDTEAWVAYVSALNAAEAPQLADLLPMHGVRGLLEIGGNTGGFARVLLARHPNLRVTVLDLPAVCEIGRRGPAEPRLAFVPGDAREDEWPMVAGAAPDMVVFKSVLHDWETDAAHTMLQRAAEHVTPGGSVVVLERGRLECAPQTQTFASASNLVFAGYYRSPDWYAERLDRLGLSVQVLGPRHLEMPFFAIVGRR